MRFGRLTACITGAFLLSIFQLDAYAQQSIKGDCNIQLSGGNNQVGSIICYPGSGLPTKPPTSVDSQDPYSVIFGGGWWVNYYQNEFGQFVGGGELPNQARNGSKLGVEWGGRRPVMFPQGRGIRFSMEVFGRRYFEAGQYCFTAYVDSGTKRNFTRVFIDDRSVLSNWYPIPGGYPEGCFVLSRGLHSIKVEYMNTGGGAKLGLSWQQKRS